MDLRHLLDTTLAGLGYEMVDLELGRGGMIRVFMDSPNGITVDDCVKVSNHLTRMFMVENIDFERLEISSPGLDRVLNKESDFTRFAGQKVKVKVRVPIDRRKMFAGTLLGLEAGRIRLDMDGTAIEIDMTNVDRVRLDPQF
ncbi:ribosome maturation factor RimP [Chitinivorax tropicus]|uniref:Ribosome maturation factor RimP n=1 Tax=Chitinivorax tropicus TaxID=714531 RepID=A0A840MGP4_9PROT|nr:ribosome maturation factor RimP [Chitinivorax tropicus]MBB5017570.1 ribosome maturation factor RimP [Chitinivorax tropicus]